MTAIGYKKGDVYIGYARTSIKEEKIENQLLKIREKKGDIPIFLDEGVSGIVPGEKREGFNAVMEYIEENNVKGLVVTELSRIGRSFLETLDMILSFEKREIDVISLSGKETWTTMEDKNMRKLITMIFTWVADMERQILIERTKQGIKRAREEGKQIGRPKREINWKKFDSYRNKKVSISAISRILDIPYPTLIAKVKGRDKE